MERKLFKDCEIKSFDDKTLSIDHFISTETKDDGGDIMRADGMVVRGKPVVLFQHGQDPVKGMEPIAKPISIAVGVNKDGKKGIIVRTQYFDGGKLTPPDNTGERLYQKAKQGYMPNWSIGWEPIEFTPIPGGGREVTQWSLHEYSQVAVGMNSEATTDIKAFAGIIILAEEKKDGAGSGNHDHSENKLNLKKEEPMENALLNKTVCKVAGYAMKVLHGAMLDRLKDIAEATPTEPNDEHKPTPPAKAKGKVCPMCGEDVANCKCEMDSETCARKVLDEFTEAVTPHAKSYIKALVEMEAEDTAHESGDDTGNEKVKGEEKNMAEATHKIQHKAMKMAYKAMMKEMDSCKGCKEINVEEKATDILTRHKELAQPYACKYIDALRVKKAVEPKLMAAAEKKSIGERVVGQIHHTALKMLHDAMLDEMVDSAFTSVSEKEYDSDKAAAGILDEYHSLAVPYVKAFIEEIRKHYAPNMQDDTPAGATGTNPLVQVKMNEHKQSFFKGQDPVEPKADPAPEGTTVLNVIDETPAEEKGLNIDPVVLAKIIGEAVQTSVTAEIRKAKGKLD